MDVVGDRWTLLIIRELLIRGAVVIEVSGGSVTTRLGTAAAPDLVLRGEPQLILALLSGHLTAVEVTDHGLEIRGDASVQQSVLPQPVAA